MPEITAHPHPDQVVTPAQWCAVCGVHRAGEADGIYGTLCPACGDTHRQAVTLAAGNEQQSRIRGNDCDCRTVAQHEAHIGSMIVIVDEAADYVAAQRERIQCLILYGGPHQCYCQASSRIRLRDIPDESGPTSPTLESHACYCLATAGQHHLHHTDGEPDA